MRTKRLAAVGLCSAVALLGTTGALAAAGGTGPSSSQSPYLVGVQPGVSTKSVLTVGDVVGGYKMVGIPDGMGAFDNKDGTFTLVMNHELGSSVGITRAHGGIGAFVSKWVVDKRSLKVLSGGDLIQNLQYSTGTAAINRLCSGDLPAVSAFFDAKSGKGTKERIFMSGEEGGIEGRVFAHVVTGPDAGTSYELPYLGKFAWENAVAMPGSGDKTVVIGMDDGTGGQVYVYVGTKQTTGTTVERAGLTNGVLYGLQVTGVATETDTTDVGSGASFSLVPLGDVSAKTGATLNADSVSAGVTTFNRPEDGSWDPKDPEHFYFATTASFTGISHLWKLSFDDVRHVLEGGTATIEISSPAYDPLKSSADQAGPRMMDNLTVTSNGQVIIQEDVGNQDYIGGVFQYDPERGSLARVAQHDPARFTPGAAGFLTRDEESSGIIPAPFLGENSYLVAVQAHYATGDAETVEGGQLLVIQIPPARGRH